MLKYNGRNLDPSPVTLMDVIDIAATNRHRCDRYYQSRSQIATDLAQGGLAKDLTIGTFTIVPDLLELLISSLPNIPITCDLNTNKVSLRIYLPQA
jgi:hypothetical protein